MSNTTASNEVWREHPTLVGIRVSTLGRVQTCWKKVRPNNQHGPCMELWDDWRDTVPCAVGRLGYLAVCLYTAERGQKPRHKNYPVHRLVLQTFVGPRPQGHWCCHNNGKATDNRLENLRWDTPKGNSSDAKRHGTQVRGSRHGFAKLNEEKVREIIGMLMEEVPVTKIAKKFGVSTPTIIYIRDRRTWTHVPWHDE